MPPIDEKIDRLTHLVEGLKTELGDLRKKVDGDKGSDKESKKTSDNDLAYAAALLPFYGLTSFGFGNPMLLPFGLRLAAARTLVLHRALERAAAISKELVKADDDKADHADQVMKWIVARTPEEKKAVVELMKAFWSGK